VLFHRKASAAWRSKRKGWASASDFMSLRYQIIDFQKLCRILSQILLLCFPKGVAAPPLDSRSQGLCPLDPTPHPLAPSPINGEGEQQAVPLSGGRVSGRGEVCWAKQHYNNAEYGSAGSGEPIFWMPILEGA